MLVIEVIKAFGAFLSFYLVICHKRQHLHPWITLGRYGVDYGDLMLGYYGSTLICSLIYWPNVSTYAVWFYYGTVIAAISTYGILFLKRPQNKYVIVLNLLIVAEFISIASDDLYWEWQPKIIVIGLCFSFISPIIIAGCKYYIERLK